MRPHDLLFPPEETVSLGEAVRRAEAYLAERGIEDAAADAWYLLEHVTGYSRAFFLAERRAPLQKEQKAQYAGLVERRGSHIPLQHLTGGQEFMGLRFQVNPHVLIPRQDTETLVEEALERMKQSGSCERAYAVLDLCTGSGCIAVSLALLGKTFGGKRPEVWALDVSGEALATAAENAERLGAQVQLLHSDLFEQVKRRFDMIVSNPPYIRTAVLDTLAPEVRQHEPVLALDGGADGLAFYRVILKESPRYLYPNGWLLLEIGCDQGREVEELMRGHGFVCTQVIRDLAGKDRVVAGRMPEA